MVNFLIILVIHPSTCSLYGHEASEIVPVELIIAEDQSRNDTRLQNSDIDYWGWLDKDRDRFTMIYAKYFLLNMCFPSGIKASEEAQQGKAYRLMVKPISQVSN